MTTDKNESTDKIVEFMKKDPYLVQALKDFESLGFLEICNDGIRILDRDGLQKYMNDFGKHEILNGQKAEGTDDTI
tara:strand:+ start:356 stop:583 length:228 start_codon:yes stop_codon:yes gene_type:complete